jgi:Rha family phage regulatory protein
VQHRGVSAARSAAKRLERMTNTNELEIFSRDGQLYTDSREVARMIGKRHDHLIRDIDGYAEILGQSKDGFAAPKIGVSDFFVKSSYKDGTGRTLPCYLITKKGCEFVANKLTGEKGICFTAIYVNAFHTMEDQISKPQLPQDYLSALKALVASEEEKQKLTAKAEQNAPKVLFADAVATAKSSILIGDLAKLIRQNGHEIGQKRLFQWLRDKGYLMGRGESYNLPTQYSMERGLMEIKERTINNPDGSSIVTKTPKITGKGQQYFINKFLKKEV